jgi:hypothetical protein
VTRVHTVGVFYREGRLFVTGERTTGAPGSTSELLTPTPYRSATFPREWIRPHPFRSSERTQMCVTGVADRRPEMPHEREPRQRRAHDQYSFKAGRRNVDQDYYACDTRCDGLERCTFLRRFQLTGMTTSKYVQRMRMSKSCDLLQFSHRYVGPDPGRVPKALRSFLIRWRLDRQRSQSRTWSSSRRFTATRQARIVPTQFCFHGSVPLVERGTGDAGRNLRLPCDSNAPWPQGKPVNWV